MSLFSINDLSGWLYLSVLLLVFAAAIEDLIRRKISNILIMLFFIPGLAIGTLTNGGLWLVGALVTGAIVFISLFPLFSLGALGGGDVKLYAAIGSLLGLDAFMPVFFHSLVLGGAIGALIWWKCEGSDQEEEQEMKDAAGSDGPEVFVRSGAPSVPFGVPIALASFWGVYGDALLQALDPWIKPLLVSLGSIV